MQAFKPSSKKLPTNINTTCDKKKHYGTANTFNS